MPTPRNPEQQRITFTVPTELRLEAERAIDESDLTLAQLCRLGLRLALADAVREVVVTKGERDD